eukprot:scaffold125_cov240-Pinguiococcus_pyrenoidosus.AAC.9
MRRPRRGEHHLAAHLRLDPGAAAVSASSVVWGPRRRPGPRLLRPGAPAGRSVQVRLRPQPRGGEELQVRQPVLHDHLVRDAQAVHDPGPPEARGRPLRPVPSGGVQRWHDLRSVAPLLALPRAQQEAPGRARALQEEPQVLAGRAAHQALVPLPRQAIPG